MTTVELLELLNRTVHAIEKALGCRGRWFLEVKEAPGNAYDQLTADYLKQLRDKYEQKPEPNPMEPRYPDSWPRRSSNSLLHDWNCQFNNGLIDPARAHCTCHRGPPGGPAPWTVYCGAGDPPNSLLGAAG